MFPFFRWNAQAQIPPKGSFIQKYRFAFGEWLTFKGSLHVVCCWDVWPDFMRVSPRHCWPLLGTAEFCTAFVGALGKRHACQWCCSSLLSNQSLASPWDCEGWCLLVPSGCSEQSCAIILSSAAGLAFCRPTHSHSVLPAARQNVIYNGLEFRNLLQLKNVFFVVVCKSLLVCACRCCHVNILQLLGFSVESDLHCLIYPYLPNGSLQNQLQCQVSNNMGLLSVCCYKSCPVTVWKAIKSLSLLRTSQNVPREVACEYEKALF